jgi:hypothetical protein
MKMRSWANSAFVLLVAGWLAVAAWHAPAVGAQSCQGTAAPATRTPAAAGCPWSGPVVINSDHSYWMAASEKMANGKTRVVWAHVIAQCRVAVNFKLKGPHKAVPQSVSLQDFQEQPTAVQVEFYGPGAPRPFWGFKVLPSRGAADTGAGLLTTTWPAEGTDVKMPLEFTFPALAYSLDDQLLSDVPAPVLHCRGAPGTSGKIHLVNRYGDRDGDPYRRTQMSETTDSIETPAAGPKGNFAEASILRYALQMLNMKYPATQGLLFRTATLSNPRGTRIDTIGSSIYRFGYLSPMTRPKPCN